MSKSGIAEKQISEEAGQSGTCNFVGEIYFIAHVPDFKRAIHTSFDETEIKEIWANTRQQYAWNKEPKIYSCIISAENIRQIDN